jgi:hypothetical protein
MTQDVLKYLQPNAVIPIDMETTTALVNALKERLAQPEQEPVAHWSDCAVHSEPAYPKSECDCGGIVAVAASLNLSILEVPIRFRPRWAGESKMRLSRIIETVSLLWSIRSRSKLISDRSKLNLKYRNSDDISGEFVDVDHKVMLCAETSTAKHLVGYIEKHIYGDILEIGAGKGSFTPLLAELSTRLVAIEPNERYFIELQKAVSMRENVSALNGTLKSLDREHGAGELPEKFDQSKPRSLIANINTQCSCGHYYYI